MVALYIDPSPQRVKLADRSRMENRRSPARQTCLSGSEIAITRYVNGFYHKGAHAQGAVRPPEGKSAAPEDSGGEIRGGIKSRISPLRMCDMDPLKGHYNKLRIKHSRLLLQTLGTKCLTLRTLFKRSPPVVAIGSRHAYVFERCLTGRERHLKSVHWNHQDGEFYSVYGG